MRPTVLTAVLAAGVGVLASEAGAHDLEGHVSPAGIDFVAGQLPSYVPTQVEPPPVTQTLFTCPGDRPVIATQHDTEVDIEVHDLELSVPRDDTLRLDLTLSVDADGKVFLENPFLCYGETTCDDTFSVDHGRAVIDFDVAAVGGEVRVSVSEVDLQIGPADIHFALSGCAIDDLVNWVIDFAKEWYLDFLLGKVEEIAAESLSPVLQEMVAGFTSFEGDIGIADFSAALESVSVRAAGISVAAEADLTSPLPPVACVGEDPGEPAPHAGAGPDASAGAPSHLGVAVNLGLVDDALYHAWADGLTCLDSESLEEEYGIDLHLDHIAVAFFPGLPPGTELSLDAYLATPPRVVGSAGADAALTMGVDDITIELTARLPDDSWRRLHIDADAEATAELALDPDINAMTMQINGAGITRLDIDDQIGAADAGFDAARIHQLLEDLILPALFEELDRIPVTGPVFNLADYYVIMRDLGTSSSHAWARADLFRAPADDRRAPSTEIVEQPAGVANPSTARIVAGGTDPEVPTELLRYRVTIDGEESEPTYVRAFDVGAAGVTATYDVHVTAIDLAGNEDPVGVQTSVTVDGIAPSVTLLGDRRFETRSRRIAMDWTMSDDLTGAGTLRPRVEIYRMADAGDALSAQLVGSTDLAPGATSASVELDPGDVYRVEVHVADEAGNETRTSLLVTVSDSGGCNASGPGGAPLLALLMGAALGVARRRRARA